MCNRWLRDVRLQNSAPIVPGVNVPTALPACPSLRNEPCRTYQAFTNNGS